MLGIDIKKHGRIKLLYALWFSCSLLILHWNCALKHFFSSTNRKSAEALPILIVFGVSETGFVHKHSLPIQTSPKQPCPSLRSRRRDSLGISQASLAKPWVWGFSTGQISVRLWHSPSACSVEHKKGQRMWSSFLPDHRIITSNNSHSVGLLKQMQHATWENKDYRGTETEPTAIVIDKLLQVAELCAWCDVEASAVELPDLIVLHIQPFGVVIVQYRQTVGTCREKEQKW